MRPTFLVAAILLSCAGIAQSYNGPESVEYDPVGDRYFISNTGSGQILQRDQAGTLTTFASSSPAPYGIEIKGDTLFACCSGRVKGFLLSDGSEVFDLDLNASFLNGITTDGAHVYVTDFSAKKILKIDPAASSFTELVANTINTPNGIVFDPVLQRLWVAGWGASAKIKSYDPVSGAELSTFTTAVSSIDGIALDCNGYILVASWSPNRISRFEPTFTDPAVNVLSSGLSSPADIDYDAVHHRICIPNSGNNTVTLFEYGACATSIVEPLSPNTLLAPNPTDGMLRFSSPPAPGTIYRILDARGSLVASGRFPAGALDVTGLKPGAYIIALASAGIRSRFVKR